MIRLRLSLLLMLALASFAGRARAGLSFVLTPNVQIGARGAEVTFTSILSNTDPTADAYLNGIQVTIDSNLTTVTNDFFANVPGILTAGQTYSDTVFSVAIASATPTGNYSGTITMLGGTSIFSANSLASQSFEVSVDATPFSVWQLLEFGANATNPAVSGDLADPDNDGIANLLEYALNLNPNIAGQAGLPTAQLDASCGCLTLIYTRVVSATDIKYSVEGASDPGGSWSTNGIIETVIGGDGVTQTNKANDAGNPIATSGRRFMHLRVTH